jgi:hypothetical protein
MSGSSLDLQSNPNGMAHTTYFDRKLSLSTVPREREIETTADPRQLKTLRKKSKKQIPPRLNSLLKNSAYCDFEGA